LSDFEKQPLIVSNNSSQATTISAIVFISIALYNSLELLILILLGFKRHRSLYFWALLTSNILGVIPTSIGTLLQYFNLAPIWLTFTLAIIGFYFMVPGQSIVLYSRLHLVSQNYKLLRFIRYLIIIDTIILLILTTVLNAGWAFIKTPAWIQGYDVIEKVQLSWFCAQETFISTIYIRETAKLIRTSPEGDKRRIKILYELVAINLAAIIMDISLLILEYVGLYFTQVILKAMVYSIKLKLEFAVLGMLISIASRTGDSEGTTLNVSHVVY
jgi:hypothetical protein